MGSPRVTASSKTLWFSCGRKGGSDMSQRSLERSIKKARKRQEIIVQAIGNSVSDILDKELSERVVPILKALDQAVYSSDMPQIRAVNDLLKKAFGKYLTD
jgi:hypothetical protein